MITIRPAAAADADILLELIDALADYEKLDRPDADARARLRRDGFGAQPLFRAYLGEIDGRPVAYAITYRTYSSFLARPTLFLEDLFVLPEARGRGLGGAILRHLVEEAVRDDCGRMEWVVLHWNQLAIDFYERLGAERLSDWHTYRLTRKRMRALLAEGPA